MVRKKKKARAAAAGMSKRSKTKRSRVRKAKVARKSRPSRNARPSRKPTPAGKPAHTAPAPKLRPWPVEERRLVILFRKELNVPNTPGWRDKPGEWERLEGKYGRLVVQPMFVASAERLRALAQAAERDNPEYPWPDFLHYFFLYVPPGRATPVLRDILTWPQIEAAYLDKATIDAAATEAACGLSAQHLDPGPKGVGVDAAWAFAGGRGEGRRFVDVEQGWAWRKHSLLPSQKIELFAGTSVVGSWWHGTQVLGIVCGKDNSPGCRGIAPEIAKAVLISCIPDPAGQFGAVLHKDDLNTAQPENIFESVAFGIGQLATHSDATKNFGAGVLLIERTASDGSPLESLPSMLQLFRLAHNRGVTIVEAAGNGLAPTRSGQHTGKEIQTQSLSLLREGQLVDSGAIMVGSAFAAITTESATDKHARFPTSNFGDRIDCYAWGHGIVSTTWDLPDSLDGTGGTFKRCEKFGETSGAAAIIAGVALAIQGIVAAAGGAIGPAKMRSVLSDATRGTPSTAGAKIKSMPDLAKILKLDASGFCPALGIKPVLAT